MTNVTNLPNRVSPKAMKQPAETILAALEKEGDYIAHCLGIADLKPQKDFFTNDSLMKIEEGVARNRDLLSKVPAQTEVEKFAKVVQAALECCSEATLKRQIGLLLGSFPNGALTNADVFVDALMFDINDAGFSDAIIYLACRDLRRRCTFFPSIAEFMNTAEQHQRYWQIALDLPERVREKRQELEGAVAYAERALQQARAGVEDGWRDADGKLLRKREPLSLVRNAGEAA